MSYAAFARRFHTELIACLGPDKVVFMLAPLVTSHVANGDYAEALLALSGVRGEVDRFFDEVMVNTDEPLLRANRLGLLKSLYAQLNAVADISRLAV